MRLTLLALSLLASAAAAVPQSAPQPVPLPPPLPVARDVPYPGTITLSVDALDTGRGIFRVGETIPVAAAGPMVLLYPEWLPGNHAPRGPIDDVAGIRITTERGTVIPWRRDPVNVHALHLDVPAGSKNIVLFFDYVSPTKADQGRVVMTPEIANLQWNLLAFYPAGWFTRQIPVEANVRLPGDWDFGTALETESAAHSAGIPGFRQIRFRPVSFETLVDSPVFAGRNFRREQLAPDVWLNIVADTPEELAATPEQIERHRELVRQAGKLFGAHHYDKYNFLLAISDKLGGIGLEHHRSSENGVVPGYFIKWEDNAGRHNLLPHEYTHSWNGKYRRGADLFTPDFSVPMRNSLLWVYEGQTQFWGYVLQARSGLVSREDTLAGLAMIAASLDTRPARSWRPLIDTTNDPILAARRPQPWVSWQRSEDYYNEGMLIWLEADAQIRELTRGTRSMDDFARAFFGQNDRDWGVSTYTLDDVVATLNGVAPYDWARFLDERVEQIRPRAPLDWIAKGGYRLVYTPEPTSFWKSEEKARKITDLSYSLGLVIDKDDALSAVLWNGPAFQAGLTVGTTIVSVGGKAYKADLLRAAVADAAQRQAPIQIIVKRGDRYDMVSIDYHGGPRYPRLEKVATGVGGLDRLLAPK